MSAEMYSQKFLIRLPTPLAVEQRGAGWIRTWNVRLCEAVASRSALDHFCASISDEHARVAVGRIDERELDLTVAHVERPTSDQDFLLKPKRMFCTFDREVGRIASIQSVPRSLCPAFRPAFHLALANPSREPAIQLLALAVRSVLERAGWERAVVTDVCERRCVFSRIDFSRLSEIRISHEGGEHSLTFASFSDEVYLLARSRTEEITSICEQFELLMSDVWAREALAS